MKSCKWPWWCFHNDILTRWVALMIQLEQQQHGEFVGGGGGVAYTNYLYPARWGWIKNLFHFNYLLCFIFFQVGE